MASQYPPFIFSDSVPASQMVEHARAVNEGMRIAELGKARQAEGMFRIAQLQQQQKAQQEKNELDRMIAQSQIAQAKIGDSFREKELAQQGKIAEDRNKNYLEGLRIQYPEGKINPQVQATEAKIEYDRELERKATEQDTALDAEWNALTNNIESAMAKKGETIPARSLMDWIDRPERAAIRWQINKAAVASKKKTDAELDAKLIDWRRRQQTIEAILSERGKAPVRRAPGTVSQPSAMATPSVSQLLPPPVADPRIDAIKREAAAAIQRGANPAEVYSRMEQLGVPIR